MLQKTQSVIEPAPTRSSTSSRTRAASALPDICFITAPISAPAACTLPSRILATDPGLAAIAASTASARAPLVRDDHEAARPTTSADRALAGHDALERLAGQLVGERARLDQLLHLDHLLRG